MLSEFRKRKLKRLVDTYDFDGNGYVEKADYEKVFQRIAVNLGWTPGTQVYDTMHEVTLRGWEGLKQVADFNNDDRVTHEEFLQAVETVVANRELFDKFALGTTESSFMQQDANGDGKISREESIAYTSGYNMTKADAAAAFDKMDRNGDGYITKDEMLQNVTDFFMSDDPDAPGNWLMGPF